MHVWDTRELKANDNKACAVIFLLFLHAQKRKEIRPLPLESGVVTFAIDSKNRIMCMCSLFSHSRALTYCMQNPQAVPPSLTSATILTFFFTSLKLKFQNICVCCNCC